MDVPINLNNPPKAATISIMDLGKQLLESAREGQTEHVNQLMCRGAPFTTDWLGQSALHVAAENNHLETCKVLLRAGISKDSRTKVERTPLHLAVCNGHMSIAKLLLEHKCDVNAKDMLKHTPLHWAVEEDHPAIVRLLMKHGADPYNESKNGDTPLSIAKELKFDDMQRFMSTYKHQVNVSLEEQQEATNSLMQEMQRDNDLHTNQDIAEGSSNHSQANSNSSNQNKRSLTLQLLQEELVDDGANNFLGSAVACGRQIIITEVGKEILNVQNTNASASKSPAQPPPTNTVSSIRNGLLKQKPVGIIVANSSSTPKVLTKQNIVKRITPEQLSKLCVEGKVIKTVCNPQNVLSNGTIRIPKYRLKIGNSDSPVKVINNISSANSSLGSATLTPKNVVIKSEPPHLANFTTITSPKVNKTTIGTTASVRMESTEKMVQLPMTEYLELVKQCAQVKELTERLAKLEEHCEKTNGFVRNKTVTHH